MAEPSGADRPGAAGTSQCPKCGRSTPHSEMHHEVEDSVLSVHNGDANVTWLVGFRRLLNPTISQALLLQMLDKLVDEIVKGRTIVAQLQQAREAAERRAEQYASALDNIASGEMGVNSCIRHARKTLGRPVDA